MTRPDVEQRSSGGVRVRFVVYQIRSGEMAHSIRAREVRDSIEKPRFQLGCRWGYRLMARTRLQVLRIGYYRRSNARSVRFCGRVLHLSARRLIGGYGRLTSRLA